MPLPRLKPAALAENTTATVRDLAGDVEHAEATFVCNPNHETAAVLQAAQRTRETAVRQLRANFAVVKLGK
jgi:hypothetical protein